MTGWVFFWCAGAAVLAALAAFAAGQCATAARHGRHQDASLFAWDFFVATIGAITVFSFALGAM